MSNSLGSVPKEVLQQISRLLGDEATITCSDANPTATEPPNLDLSNEIAVLYVGDGDEPTRTSAFTDDRFVVSMATTAGEALQRYEDHTFDCIVSAYDLPGANGIELLETVRADNATVPFLLYTETGSETIASQAITAGVTDYLPSDSHDDPNRLARRIETHVERYHSRQRRHGKAAQFEQLRDLFEFSLDAAGLYVWNWNLDAGTVERYPNSDRLFGLDKDQLEPMFDTYLQRIHSDHRDVVETTLRNALDTASPYQVEYSLEGANKSPVWIKEHGTVVTDDRGIPSHVVGTNILITEQKKRERELQWERELNRTLHEALVESRTRADLESTIVRQLRENGHNLVWIGDSLVDEIQPRVTAGTEGYIDALELDTNGDLEHIEPALRAVREGQTVFVDDFTTEPKTDWQQKALDNGLRTGAALPLVYSDIFYGVLAVYDDEPGTLDGATQRLFAELTDTLAFVIHNIETKNALAADRRIHATLQLVGPDYYLRDLVKQADCDSNNTRLMVHETLRHGNEKYIQYVSVNGAPVESIVEAATAHPVVDTASVIAADTNPRIQLIHRSETPEATLTTVGARVRSTSVTARRADILVEVSSKMTLKTAIETLEASNEHVSVLSSIERDSGTTDDDGPLAELTERQATVLRAAYHRGYFEKPRESSAKEVAASLGISHPTMLEHLRLAQEKVFKYHLT